MYNVLKAGYFQQKSWALDFIENTKQLEECHE
jgi:hypothetical protein